MKKLLTLLAISAASSLVAHEGYAIPLADSSTTRADTELNELDIGWSVRQGLLGRTIFNERGERLGEVTDLIVSTEQAVSYLIIDASLFAGLEHHEVALPLEQVRAEGPNVILPGATRPLLAAMPAFRYATDLTRRAHFVARVERRIAEAKARIAVLERDAARASRANRKGLDEQRSRIARDLAPVEAHLAALTHASEARWQEFTAPVERALEELRISFIERRPA